MTKDYKELAQKRFNQVKDFTPTFETAKTNIQYSRFTEDGTHTTRVETLVSGSYGSYITLAVCTMWGLVEPLPNGEINRDIMNEPDAFDGLIYDQERFEGELDSLVNEVSPLSGTFYFGFDDTDGDYCLFYSCSDEDLEADGLSDEEEGED